MTQSIVLKYKDFVGNTLEVKCICTVTARTLLFDFMLKWDKIHMARIHNLEDNRHSKNGFQSNAKPFCTCKKKQNQITKLFTSFYVKKFSYLKQAIKNATVNSDLKHSQLNLRCFKILDIRWHKTREEPTFENSKEIKVKQCQNLQVYSNYTENAWLANCQHR